MNTGLDYKIGEIISDIDISEVYCEDQDFLEQIDKIEKGAKIYYLKEDLGKRLYLAKDGKKFFTITDLRDANAWRRDGGDLEIGKRVYLLDKNGFFVSFVVLATKVLLPENR